MQNTWGPHRWWRWWRRRLKTNATDADTWRWSWSSSLMIMRIDAEGDQDTQTHTRTHSKIKTRRKSKMQRQTKSRLGQQYHCLNLGLALALGHSLEATLICYLMRYNRNNREYFRRFTRMTVHRLPPSQSLFCLILQTWFQFLVLKFSGKLVWPTQLTVGYRAC